MTTVPTVADDVTDGQSGDSSEIGLGDVPFEVVGTPFVMVPLWVALNSSPTATALYVHLGSFINTKRGDRTVWPTEKTLARRINLTDRRMRPYLKELQALGAVDVRVHRYGTNRMKKRNVYIIRFDPPPGFEGHLSGDEFDEAEPVRTPTSAPVRTSTSRPERPADSPSPELDEKKNYKNPLPPPPRTDVAVPAPREGEGEAAPEDSVDTLVAEVLGLRPEWSSSAVRKALAHRDVVERKNPALIRAAMLLVAADRTSQSPGRLAYSGPWWSQAAASLRSQTGTPADGSSAVFHCGNPRCNTNHWIEDDDGDLVGRCPICHPSNRNGATR